MTSTDVRYTRIDADGLMVTTFTDGSTTTFNPANLTRQEDGTVTFVDEHGAESTFPDVATAKRELHWGGLVFSDAERAAQQAFEEATPVAEYIRGRYQRQPHPMLARYVQACMDGAVAAAAQVLEDHEAVRGYTQYAGTWNDRLEDLVVVLIAADVENNHSRPFVAGDRALARKDGTGYVVFSARTHMPTVVPSKYVIEV